tara:strand:- start:1603 stop:2667 length:1065 start_codon:yes stop_codon:yes gene_type:complete
MGGSKTVIKQPDQIDPAESMGEYLFGKDFKGSFEGITDKRLQQRLLDAEAEFRPQYTALELADQEAGLFGTEDQAGLIDLQQRAGEKAIDFEEDAKRRETALLGELGGDVTAALRAADPESTKLADLQSQQAQTLYAESEGQLSPERAREAEQAARMAGVSRGRVGDSGTLAQELLGREASRAQLRAEARQAGQMGFQQSRALGGDPSQFLFGRPTQQTAMGASLYGQAAGLAAQPTGPQLFDPNVGINLAMQQRSQDMTLQGAQAQANASQSAGRAQAFGKIASSLIGLCWVAREVYGAENPRWLQFRQWVIHKSPNWFFRLYSKYGEKFAQFISNKPFIKNIIRKWMNTKIS